MRRKVKCLSSSRSFHHEEAENVEEYVGLRSEPSHVGNRESILFEEVGELIFVGDLAKVDGCEIFEVGFDFSSEFLERSLLLEECHEEIDLSILREKIFGDFECFDSVGHEHET